jgi:RimJ/RimL family protein N-acetyltransferase
MTLELTGERLRAREWRANDGPEVWRLVQDQNNIFGPPGFVASAGDAEMWVSNEVAHAGRIDRTRFRFALELLDGGRLIGGCRIHIEDVNNKMASIGMALHHPYQGQGYGTEAARLALGLAFEQLGIHRVEALVEPSNKVSLALVRKLGFTHEGLLRERIREGSWIDTEIWSLLDHEWRAR